MSWHLLVILFRCSITRLKSLLHYFEHVTVLIFAAGTQDVKVGSLCWLGLDTGWDRTQINKVSNKIKHSNPWNGNQTECTFKNCWLCPHKHIQSALFKTKKTCPQKLLNTQQTSHIQYEHMKTCPPFCKFVLKLENLVLFDWAHMSPS